MVQKNIRVEQCTLRRRMKKENNEASYRNFQLGSLLCCDSVKSRPFKIQPYVDPNNLETKQPQQSGPISAKSVRIPK